MQHYSLLEVGKLFGGQGVSLADDGDDVDSGAEALHQLEINFSEANIEQKMEARAQGNSTRTLLATEEARKHRKEILRALSFLQLSESRICVPFACFFACLFPCLACQRQRKKRADRAFVVVDEGRANEREKDHLPVAGGGDKVEKGVDTVVAEARVTLDPGLF